MPKFISDDEMAKISPDNLISDQDMAAMEEAEARPGFLGKIASIPSNLYQTGKTLLTDTPSDISKALDNPGQAADVAARGLARGASWLDINPKLNLEAEKVIAKHLPQALGGISDEDYKNLYERGDDNALINANLNRERSLDQKFPATHLASNLAGFVAGNTPLSMIAKTGTQSTSKALNEGLLPQDALIEGGEDALINAGLTYGPKLVAKGIPKALNAVSGGLDSTAESLAKNATGATGIQASKFRDGAGKQLLDRGIVKFFDSPENVAERANSVAENAAQQINSVLSDLDKKGVTASIPNVIDALQSKVSDLNKIPGNDALVSKLQGEIDSLNARVGLDQGPPELSRAEIPISAGEQAKRNFANNVNYASPVADQNAAFHSAGAFRSEVERSAEAADPNAANVFKTAKDTYGLIAPIAQAAEKRAAQLGQNPLGGLHDVTSFIGGGPAGVVAKRALFPRISSSLAVTADAASSGIKKTMQWGDKLSQILETQPERLGKYAIPLKNAAARGAQSLGVANYILQSTDPDYQRLLQDQDSK